MQIPTRNTPVARCETLAAYLIGSLRQYPRRFEVTEAQATRLAALATMMSTATDALVATQSAYRAAVLATVMPRLDVQLVDLRADGVVKSVKRSAEEAGAGIDGQVFPEGTTPIIKPVGPSEVAALIVLSGRIGAASEWTARDAQRARIDAVHVEYAESLAARRTAQEAATAARAMRNDAKERFLDAYAAVAGALKELFPRDRPRQDVFFDTIRESAGDDDGGEPDEPAAPEA